MYYKTKSIIVRENAREYALVCHKQKTFAAIVIVVVVIVQPTPTAAVVDSSSSSSNKLEYEYGEQVVVL